jgi:flagellar hook-basal body complex protein FliE
MRSEFVISPPIDGLKNVLPSRPATHSKASFGEELKKTLEQADGFQKEADKAVTGAAGGGTEQIHETMIKMEEAELSMRLLLKVRTKVMDAYQEIMRMQF